MDSKEMLHKQIDKLFKAMEGYEAGSDEYEKCLNQLKPLVAAYSEIEKAEKEQRLEKIKIVIKWVEVGAGIVLPVVGLVGITAKEEGISFTGALKGYAQMFVPKSKLF